MNDLIMPFRLEPFAVRGRFVRLGTAIDQIVARHGYPEPVAALLGEALVLAPLLAGALKYDGVFTLQTKGDGPVRLLVADVTSAGALRGYAQFDAAAVSGRGVARAPVPRLLGAGYLAFTVDQGDNTERYQGIVELQGATLADCVNHYFRQSEQIETGIVVAAVRPDGAWRGGGLMLQRLPPGADEASAGLGFTDGFEEARDDDWRRALMLMSTATPAELCDPDLAPETLLLRLFHEEGVRAWAAQPLAARCRCSLERVRMIIASLPPEELRELAVDGKLTLNCEFCGAGYVIPEAEIATRE